jgi:basic amino acid/polyamine antiporter, APA family
MSQKDKINSFSFTMIVIGLVIGMGIFRTAATSAKYAIVPSVYFTAWVLGGLIALCGALSFAEIGSRYPVTGGYYKIFSYAYHPSIAFGINCICLISNAASISGIALIGSGYLLKLFPQYQFSDVYKAIVSASTILVFYGINLLGLLVSSKAQNILITIKILMLLVIIGCLFSSNSYAATSNIINFTTIKSMDWLSSLGISLIAVAFTYSGFQQTINFGNEVINPIKNVPKGIFYGIFIIIALYLLVSLSYYIIIGFDAIKQEEEIAYVLINKVFGNWGANVFCVFLFIGVMSYVNALLMACPRIMFAMSQEGVLPKTFANENKKTKALVVSLTAFTAVCLVTLCYAQTFEKILNFSMFLDCFGMIASTATLFVLRKKTKHLNNSGIYKSSLYPLPTLLFIASYLFIGISIYRQTPSIANTGIIVLLGCIASYFLFVKKATTQHV